MRYRTKGELLGYLGKDRRDVRLIDRMMVRGEVGHDEDGYYLIKQYEANEWEMKYKELEADYIKWIQEHPAGRWVDKNTTHTTDEVSDLEYLNNEYIKLEENRERALRKCYEFMVGKKIFDKEKNPFEDFFLWATWVELK